MAEHVFAKCARRLIPFMGLLYLVNYIDRTNAGFAALTMNKDLGFSPVVFGFGAGIFFIGYSIFQVPANVILKRVGARRWNWALGLRGLNWTAPPSCLAKALTDRVPNPFFAWAR